MSNGNIVLGAGYDSGGFGCPIKVTVGDKNVLITAPLTKTRRSPSPTLINSSTAGVGSIKASEEPSIPVIVPNFSSTLKAGRRVDFINKSLNAVEYVWFFGDGRSATFESPVKFYLEDGQYEVILRAYDGSGNYEEKVSLFDVTDIVEETKFTYIQGGIIVYFIDTSTVISSETSEWDFGDGTTVIQENPSHIFPGNGTYSVTLKRGEFIKIEQITIDVELTLSCDAMTGATGYKWERSEDGLTGWTEIADTASESVGITEAVHGVKSTDINYFRVKAYNGAGESDYSDIVNVRCE